MTVTVGAYDTNSLMGVVRNIPTALNFWRKLAFGDVHTFDTEKISFDVISKGRRMAPFVAPNVQGKPMQSKGFATETFSPAYIKPKMPVDPSRVIKRSAGEMFGGSFTPAQRRNAIVADILSEQKAMIEKRWEWMAAQAIITGAVVVSGESYPSTTVDFGRDASQTITLTGADLWTASTSVPLTNLETWYLQTALLSTTQVTDLVFGPTAWTAFCTHASVKELLNLRRGTDIGNGMEISNGLGTQDLVAYKGALPNGPRLWVYADVYENDSGTNVNMLDPTYVIGVGQVDGVQAFGAIMDADAGYTATAIFSKMWKEQDPSVEMIMSQSAPLMVPRRVNACFRAKVA